MGILTAAMVTNIEEGGDLTAAMVTNKEGWDTHCCHGYQQRRVGILTAAMVTNKQGWGWGGGYSLLPHIRTWPISAQESCCRTRIP